MATLTKFSKFRKINEISFAKVKDRQKIYSLLFHGFKNAL